MGLGVVGEEGWRIVVMVNGLGVVEEDGLGSVGEGVWEKGLGG